MKLAALLTHPVARIVIASILTGALAWAGGSQTEKTRSADTVAASQFRCDSTVSALEQHALSESRRADSLQAIITKRDEAYARHISSQRYETREIVIRERSREPWLLAAGSFVVGGVVGYLIGDHAHTATAVASATSTVISGGKHGKKHPKKHPRRPKKWDDD